MDSALSRLEAVTARLEKLESTIGSGGGSAPAAAAGGGDAASSASVAEFDDILNGPLAQLEATTAKIGDKDVTAAVQTLAAAFKEQRTILVIASKGKKPDSGELQKILAPCSEHIGKAQGSNVVRGDGFNHTKAIAEMVPGLGWVLIEKTPSPFVTEYVNAGQFYSNKVLVQYKSTDQNHVDWVNQLVQLFKDLAAYIKKVHTTGLVWNASGPPATAAMGGGAPAAPAAGGPPPPPAAPPKGFNVDDKPKPATGNANPAAGLFAEINSKGASGVTKGLRKVTDDMKSKNQPNKSSVVPASGAKAPAKAAPKYGGAAVKKDPVFKLDGTKWAIEHQDGNNNIVIEADQVNLKQTVYIYNCKNTVVQVKGKLNTISVDNCTKTSVVFHSCLSSCEVVNSRSIQLQVLEKVPTMAIDSTSGCQVFLSKESVADTIIVSSKSSEMNVVVPGATDNDDFVEHPVPEQYVTKWDGKAFTTEPATSLA